MSIRCTVPLLALLAMCNSSWAASFRCEKGRTDVEKLVCTTESLSELDSRLGRAYALALNDASPDQRPGVISEQKKWLESVRNRCAGVACLTMAYVSRLHVLSSIRTGNTTAEYVTDEKELSAQTSAFQRSLARAGTPGNLSCALMVRLISDQQIGRDQSYGATCTLNGHQLTLCDDTMVGKLTVKSGSLNGAAVADFVADNCPPGG